MGSGHSMTYDGPTSMTNCNDARPVYGGYPSQGCPAPIYPPPVNKVQPTFQMKPRPINFSQPQPVIQQECQPIVINEVLLEEYMCCQREIASMERDKPLQKLQDLICRMQKYTKDINELKDRMDQLDKEKHEVGEDVQKAGIDLIKEIDAIEAKSKDGKSPTPPITRADRIDKQKEVVEFELKTKKSQYNECEAELELLNAKVASLLDCYLKEDEILVSMFSQCNASEKEAALCQKLSELEAKKQRIETARKSWKEAQLLLEYSCKKLALAVQQWQDLPEVPKICLEVRYSLSEEVEKKMREMGRSLEVEDDFGSLPHCTPEELAALEAMAAGSPPGTVDERYLKCLDNYSESHKRAICMLKWFNKVLNTTIHRDLVDVCEEVRQTSQAVRVERVKCLKERIKTMRGGKDFDYDIQQKKAVTDEGLKKAINGYKAKVEAKSQVKVRRGSNASLSGQDKAQRRGSNGRINGGGNELKGKARMEHKLGQQLTDLRGRRNERMVSAAVPPAKAAVPPAAAKAAVPPPTPAVLTPA